MRVVIISPLVGDGTMKNSFRPQLADDYSILTWTDVTDRQYPNLPGAPTAILIEAECDEAQLAIVESNPNYFVVSTE